LFLLLDQIIFSILLIKHLNFEFWFCLCYVTTSDLRPVKTCSSTVTLKFLNASFAVFRHRRSLDTAIREISSSNPDLCNLLSFKYFSFKCLMECLIGFNFQHSYSFWVVCSIRFRSLNRYYIYFLVTSYTYWCLLGDWNLLDVIPCPKSNHTQVLNEIWSYIYVFFKELLC
jgi:hypothetical protein